MELLFLGLVIGIAVFGTVRFTSYSYIHTSGARAGGGSSIRVKRTRDKRWIIYTSLVFIPVAFALGLLAISVVKRWEFLDSRISETNLPMAVFYFAVMVAGMGAEYMFGLKSWRRFRIEEFLRPFWVSLIVFSVPWSIIDKESVSFASIIACYQNGFFWKSVLKTRGKEKE